VPRTSYWKVRDENESDANMSQSDICHEVAAARAASVDPSVVGAIARLRQPDQVEAIRFEAGVELTESDLDEIEGRRRP
jgi:hypothetical protein